ncbi:MAG: MarR family transcriptional regulator [Phycisphaerales bacterium]|nr:MarR family transcriptional regulator [Phycisphaerales bacterium]
MPADLARRRAPDGARGGGGVAAGPTARPLTSIHRVAAKPRTPAARSTPRSTEPKTGSGWTFLSNHAHVLLLLAKEPEIRLRDVAERVGITERAVQRIVADLEQSRYIERVRTGRRNRYKVHPEMPLRHPIEAHRKIASLIHLVVEG